MKNIYFVISAESKNDVCAIAEAHKLIRMGGPEYTNVEVRTCGTKELIAHVFSDGAVGLVSKNGIHDALDTVRDFDTGRDHTECYGADG